jgi:hypothetical protein
MGAVHLEVKLIKYRLIVGLALGSISCARVDAQVRDPQLSTEIYQACMTSYQSSMQDACSPDGGGPKGSFCLRVGRMRQACINQPISAGTITPKYLVTGLLYSPPGCTSSSTLKCGVQSSVDYASGSSLGTKLSISSSVKSGNTVKIDFGISIPGIGTFGNSEQDEYSVTNTDTTTTSISKARTVDISVSSNGDGIDHNQDKILLLLNPLISVAKAGSLIHWGLGFSGATPIPFELPVAYLKDPSQIPAPIQRTLDQANITTSDLQAMLKLDPLATLDHAPSEKDLDPNRFAKLLTFDYERTQVASDCNGGVCVCTQVKNTFTNSYSTETSNQIINAAGQSYSASATFKQDVSAPTPAGPPVTVASFSEGFTDVNSISYTSSSTLTNSQSNTNSASVSVSCPSSTWAGQNFVDVYWDGVFGSFAFVLRDLLPSEKLLVKQHIEPLTTAESAALLSRLRASSKVRSMNGSPDNAKQKVDQQKPPKSPLLSTGTLLLGDKSISGVLDKNGDLRFYGSAVPDGSVGLLKINGRKGVKTVVVHAQSQ